MGRSGAHDFRADLARSHAVENESWWEPLYRRQWPTLAGLRRLTHDREMQRAGCDRAVTVDGGEVLVEEKVRHARADGAVYEDVLVEVRADVENGTPGWILKRDAKCDWLVYVNLPAGWALFLPWAALRGAYEERKWRWADAYGSVDSPNGSGSNAWTTRSIPVPLAELQEAVPGCVLVCPFDFVAEALLTTVPPDFRCSACGRCTERAAPLLATVEWSESMWCGCPF